MALRDKKTKAIATVQSIVRGLDLPEPVYGGREGLEAAAREAAMHDRRNLRAVS
jgi:hypothetical protein